MSNWIGGDRFLGQADQIHNAKNVVDYLTSLGWTSEAILGTIVNMANESTVNPQIWQRITDPSEPQGYGIVQWTPASKLIDWCNDRGLDYTDGDSQMLRIHYEAQNGLQWGENIMLPDPIMPDLPRVPPITFAQYTQITDAVLANKYWLAYYERPGWAGMVSRYYSAAADVQQWREWLDGYIPGPPSGNIPKLPITMYLRRRWF